MHDAVSHNGIRAALCCYTAFMVIAVAGKRCVMNNIIYTEVIPTLLCAAVVEVICGLLWLAV